MRELYSSSFRFPREILLIILLIICFNYSSFAQLTGTKTIPGDYATLAAAIADLNTAGVGTGGVTFNITAGYTETFTSPTAGKITASGTASNPILFQKSGSGANPLITAGIGTGTLDGIIILTGSDHITFDGIDVTENSANTTTAAQMEWGYALLKKSSTAPFDGCQYVTIKNCVVTLNRTNISTEGIHIYNHTAVASTSLTITDPADANSFNTIDNVQVLNAYSGIVLNGFAAVTPYTLYDQGNTIINCTVQNYGGGATNACYGIRSIYQNDIVVNSNSINNSAGGGVAHGVTLYGIMNSTGNNANFTARLNTISLNRGSNTSNTSGIYNTATGNILISGNNLNNFITGGSSGAVYFINNTATAVSVSIDSNTIGNSTQLNTTGSIYAIYNSNSTPIANIRNNLINNITRLTATSGAFYGYYNYGSPASGTETFQYNTISNISSVSSGTAYGFYSNTAAGQSKEINNNNFFNISNGTGAGVIYGIYNASGNINNLNFNNIYNLTSAGTIYGLYSGSGTVTVNNSNNIYGISSNGSASTAYALYIGGGTTDNVYKNKIYDITSSQSGGLVYGIYVSSGTTIYIYNNIVSDLKAPAATGYTAIGGLYFSGGTTIGAYYNTVYLNAVSSSVTSFGTAGIFASTTPTVDLRNNIVINTSAHVGSSAFTVAYRRGSTTLTTYSANSNANDFYAGVPGPNNFIYYDGTSSDQTLASYKSRMSPRDVNSISENPTFINNSTPPYDLHINTSTPTQLESGGVTVTTPIAITSDYDGDLRNSSTPDIGADEFNGVSQDLTPPMVSYTPLGNTGSLSERTLTTTITDLSGVPTTGIGLPVLYWKINSGTYSAATGVYIGTDQYTFTFGSGAAVNDMVYYYIVAQDNATTPNVGSTPSGASGFTANPPAASTPPPAPNSYLIYGAPLAGDYTVGAVLFNKVTGKNITFQKVTEKVMVETPVTVQDKQKGNIITTKLVSTEKVTWIPMLNGKKYEGPLFIKKSENPNYDYPYGVNGIYATITAAVADLNLRGVSAATRFLLTDAAYSTETLPITVDITNPALPNSTNTVTFKPNTGVTSIISGSTTSAVFKLNGADYIIIDGSNSDGTTKDLTIANSGTTGTTYVIQVASKGVGAGAVNNTIKNCIINNGYNTSGSYGIYVTGDDNDNLAIQNNDVSKAYVGIYVYGTSTGIDDNLIIKNNSVGSSVTASYIGHDGIMVSNTIGADISQNTVYNIISGNTTAVGLTLSTGVVSSSITRNNINNIIYTGTGGYGDRGMYINTGNASSNLTIANNFISTIGGDGYSGFSASSPAGMYFDGTTGGLNIYFNSINMNGNLSYNAVTLSAAILFYSSTNSNIDLRNNVFRNSMNNPNNAGAKNYAIYSSASATSFTNINYNDYYVSGTQGILGYLGADKLTLDAWKTATGKDTNSVSGDPKFTGVDNLHIITTAITPVSNAGTPIAGITTDYDGDARSLTTPDIGGDEYTYAPPAVLDPTGVSATPVSSSQIDIAFTPNASNQNVIIVWNLTGTFTAPSGTPPAIGEAFAGGTLLYNGTTSPQNHTGLNAVTTYYYKLFSYDGSNYSSGVAANAQTFCQIATVPFNQSFDGTQFPPQCWTLVNAGSGNNWTRSTSNTYSGAGAMAYLYNSSAAANAWAFTPEFQLVAGKNYRISFYQKVYSASWPEKLKVTVGSSATPAGQTTILWDNAGGINLTNTTYILRNADFSCTTSGSYYFAFNCYSAADQYNLYVDEVSIKEVPSVDIALTQFTQVSGLPTPKRGNFTDYNVTVNVDKQIPGGILLGKVKEGITGVHSSNINNTNLIDVDKDFFPNEILNPITIKSKVQNMGINASSYDINWSVSGVSQTPYSGPSVPSNGIDSALITFNPTDRGTFLTNGKVAAVGDEDSTNNSRYFRMRVYPNVYTRKIYDRGDNIINTFIGYGVTTIPFKSAVRYTATSNIRLEGVDFICRTEGITEGTFSIQVRAAGSSSLAPGAVLYTREYSSSDFLTGAGDYVHFAFGDDAPVIAAGSDYWITIKSPIGIMFPAAAHSSGFTPGRSFYEDSPDTTVWAPLVLGTTEYAWIMRSVQIPIPTTNITALIQGFYNGTKMVSDTITVELRENLTPFTLIESRKIVLDTLGFGSGMFTAAVNGVPYYVIVKHRNGIETWSGSAVSFTNDSLIYDFTSAQSQAYGGNQVQKNGKWCIYNGDVNQDGLVDGSDLAAVDNGNHLFLTGYLPTDLNGDGIIDGTDLALADNNNNAFVEKIVPAGAPGELTIKRTKVHTIKPLGTDRVINNNNLKNNN